MLTAAVNHKRRAAAQAALTAALAGAKTAADLEKNAKRAGLAVSTTAFFSPVSDPPPEGLAAAGDLRRDLIALTARSPVASKVFPSGPRFVAVALDGEQAADPKTWEAKKASIMAALAERKKTQVVEAYLSEWRKAAKVEINPAALK